MRRKRLRTEAGCRGTSVSNVAAGNQERVPSWIPAMAAGGRLGFSMTFSGLGRAVAVEHQLVGQAVLATVALLLAFTAMNRRAGSPAAAGSAAARFTTHRPWDRGSFFTHLGVAGPEEVEFQYVVDGASFGAAVQARGRAGKVLQLPLHASGETEVLVGAGGPNGKGAFSFQAALDTLKGLPECRQAVYLSAAKPEALAAAVDLMARAFRAPPLHDMPVLIEVPIDPLTGASPFGGFVARGPGHAHGLGGLMAALQRDLPAAAVVFDLRVKCPTGRPARGRREVLVSDIALRTFGKLVRHHAGLALVRLPACAVGLAPEVGGEGADGEGAKKRRKKKKMQVQMKKKKKKKKKGDPARNDDHGSEGGGEGAEEEGDETPPARRPPGVVDLLQRARDSPGRPDEEGGVLFLVAGEADAATVEALRRQLASNPPLVNVTAPR